MQGDARETTWNYVAGEDCGTLYTAQHKWINKVKRLKERYPSEVDIRAENDDGSIVVHLPKRWFKIAPPAKKVLSEEQREAAKERFIKYRAEKKRGGSDWVGCFGCADCGGMAGSTRDDA